MAHDDHAKKLVDRKLASGDRCEVGCGRCFADLKATEQLAAEKGRTVARTRAGLIDPADGHGRRPLADHLTD